MPVARRRVPLLLSASFIVLLALRLWLTFDALPETMASHFDGSGKPNGYQQKGAFAATSLALSIGCLLLFAALPALLRVLPASLINMPHREYWLAPARKAESVARLCAYLDWFACATMALLVAVFELVLRANLAQAALGSVTIWLLLACYLGFTLRWSVVFWRAFRLPAAAT